MAQLWIRDDAEWCIVPLDRDELRLGTQFVAVDAQWAVLADPGSPVLVNGTPVVGDLKILRDRDQLLLPTAGRAFFSTERLAEIIPMIETAREIRCPRCKTPVIKGSPAVRCPSCQLWHHQSDDRPCWSYSTVCGGCSQPTALDAGFQWTPDQGHR